MALGAATYGVPATQAEYTLFTHGTPAQQGVREETVAGPNRSFHTKLTFLNQAVAMIDNAGVDAHGGLQVYDFPEGALIFQGAVADLDLTKSSTGVNADWDGDISLGTVLVAAGATLATTEQDLIPTTSTPQAVAGVTTGDMISTTTEAPKWFDGTATAKDMFLNLLVDDADHDVTTTPCNIIVNGTIEFSWQMIGDK